MPCRAIVRRLSYRADKQVSKSKKRRQRRVEGVALTGSDSEWDKLPARIRTLVKNHGLMRLSQIRSQIAADAGLPMPKIYVEPYCWLFQDKGPAYAMACPMPCEKVESEFEFSVITTAATLTVIQDDTILRRILCHEFSHCFWHICRIFGSEDEKTGTGGPEIITSEKLPKSISEFSDIDTQRHVNPEDWFGQWDAEHFTYTEDKVFNDSTNKIESSWLDLGLPYKTLNPQLGPQGTIRAEDIIVRHCHKLNNQS